MQATVDGIIDPRAGLSTAPLPLFSISQTTRLCPCSHAAMPWPMAHGPMRLTIFVRTTWSGLTGHLSGTGRDP